MVETALEVGQDIFVLVVMCDGSYPNRKVVRGTIEKIDENGTPWVSTPNGVNCPWKKKRDEVFLTKPEAEKVLKAWRDSLPDMRELFSGKSLGDA